MLRSLLVTILVALALALAVGGSARGAIAAPAKKKAAAKKKTPVRKKAAAKLVANAGQWHRYQGRLVRRIEVTGLRRTRVWRFKQWMDTRVGRPFDAETLRHDRRRILNLQLFRPVLVRVDPEGSGPPERPGADDHSNAVYGARK